MFFCIMLIADLVDIKMTTLSRAGHDGVCNVCNSFFIVTEDLILGRLNARN